MLWDDRDSLYGELTTYKLHYFLQDGTVEILEVHSANSGRDPYPLLLKKQKLPKKSGGLLKKNEKKLEGINEAENYFAVVGQFSKLNCLISIGQEMAILFLFQKLTTNSPDMAREEILVSARFFTRSTHHLLPLRSFALKVSTPRMTSKLAQQYLSSARTVSF